eukprot:403351118
MSEIQQQQKQASLSHQAQDEINSNLQSLKQQFEVLEYLEPFWSSPPIYDYYFEVLKDGAIIEEIDLSKKSFYSIGRQKDTVDILMENPTISRKHAIIQHKDTGDIFIYDLGSTHGTFVNKRQIPANQYIKLSLNDQVRIGQSTRILLLNGPEEAEIQAQEEVEEKDDQPRKKIQIVSKKQNKEFLFKRRLDQLKKFHDQVNQLHDQKLQRIHGNEDEGVSWGMGFEEDEIAEYQRKMDEEGDDEESREGFSDEDSDNGNSDDDDVKLLNVEALRQRTDLTEKQTQMLNKVEGIRRQLKKLLDKKSKLKNDQDMEFDDKPIQGQLKGIDKKCQEMKEQLEKTEKKLKTSLRAKKSRPQKTNKEIESETVFKYHNSDDEEDEFFDRTKKTLFNKNKQQYQLDNGEEVETYDTLKFKLEQLYRQRQKLTEEMQNGPDDKSKSSQDEDYDELEAFMKQNTDLLRIEQQKKLGAQIVEVNKEIDKYTQLIAMVAPTTFQQRTQAKQQNQQQEEPSIPNDQVQQETKQEEDKQKPTKDLPVSKPKQTSGLSSTMQRLKEMSEIKEREQEERRRLQEQKDREQEEIIMQRRIQQVQERILREGRLDQGLDEDEEEDEESTGLDQESGLRNYFREIVENANRNGEKIDITKYSNLLGEYDKQSNSRKSLQGSVSYLETEIRGGGVGLQVKRPKVYESMAQPKHRNLNNDIEDEKREGEVDDWIPPTDQKGDGKTSLNERFGY